MARITTTDRYQDERLVLDAIQRIQQSHHKATASAVAALTLLSRQRVVVAASSLIRQHRIIDKGAGNAWNWTLRND